MLSINTIGVDGTHDSSFSVDRFHGYPCYLLLFVKTSARFLVNHEWQITPPGTAVLFNPGQPHAYAAHSNIYVNDWAHICSNQPLGCEQFPFGMPILLHKPNDYYSLFQIICNEFYGVNPHRDTIIHNLTSALLDKLSDEISLVSYSPLYRDLVSLRNSIYAHPEKEWSVEIMADTLSISKGYLHNIYKHYFNTPCISDMIKSRIQASSELLLSTSKSIEEIASLCGYKHTEHFIRQFKSETGITPGKYRNLFLNGFL